MKRIIFARPDNVPPSYKDFWRLAEVSGFEIWPFCDINLQLPDVTYIFAPATKELLKLSSIIPRRSELIWWNLERPDSGLWKLHETEKGASNDVDTIWAFVDRIWVSDRYYATLHPKLEYVTLGSDLGLRDLPDEISGVYELCHLSYVNARRDLIFSKLSGKASMAPCGWGKDRARILCSSRAMLYVHQTPALILPPLRFALAAAYGRPVISEMVHDPYPFKDAVHFVPYENLVEVVTSLLAEEGPRSDGKLQELLTEEFTFRRCVVAAVEGRPL